MICVFILFHFLFGSTEAKLNLVHALGKLHLYTYVCMTVYMYVAMYDYMYVCSYV